MMTAPNPFLAFHSKGYKRLVPILPPSAKISERSSLSARVGTTRDPRGKAPGVKGRDGLWRSYDWVSYENDESDLHKWGRSGAGVGIKLGDGLAAIDVDLLNVGQAGTAHDIIAKFTGDKPFVRVGRYPKALYPFRTDADLKYCRFEVGDNGERVEVLAEGKQFVADGTHPVTGKPYEWTRGKPALGELPFISAADVARMMAELRAALPATSKVIVEGGGGDTDQSRLKGDLERVRRAVRATPNTDEGFGTRNEYVAFGYMIKGALQDHPAEAFELWEEWCTRWQTDRPGDGGVNTPAVIASEWARMKPPFKSGAGLLYETAEQWSNGAFTVGDAWFDPVPDEEELNPFEQVARKEERETKADDWPEPFDIFLDEDPSELATPPKGSLPSVIERWARSEARRKGVSIAFTSASAIAVCAAAIGSSLTIRPRLNDDGWTEPACLWISLVASPGRVKSPAIREALKPLRQLDQEWAATDKPVHDAWIRASKKRGEKAPDPGPEPRMRRCLVDDATMEKQVRIHAENPRGLMRATDELIALLGSLGAYKSGSDGDRGQMLRLFDGDEITIDRVQAGSIRANRALMSTLAGTQPEKIVKLTRELGSDGMLQRFIFVVDDGTERQGIDEPPDALAMREYRSLVRELGEAEYLFSKPVRLSSEAYDVLAKSMKSIRALANIPGASEAWKGHIEKWGKLLPRIVLVFYAINNWSMYESVDPNIAVDAGTARMASLFARFLLRHSLRFYEEYYGASEQASEARWIAGHLLTRPDLQEVTRRDIYHARGSLKGDEKKLLAAMTELDNCGWVDNMSQDLRNPKRWKINPKVHARFHKRGETEKMERLRRRELLIKSAQERKNWLNGDSVTPETAKESVFD